MRKKGKLKKDNGKKNLHIQQGHYIFAFFWPSRFLMSWWIIFLTYAYKVVRTNNMPTNAVTGVLYSPAFLCQLLVQKWGTCHVKCELDRRLGIIWPWNINCNHKRASQPFIFWIRVCIRALEHNFYAQWDIFTGDDCLALLAPLHRGNSR